MDDFHLDLMVHYYYYFKAEKFGDSFVLESRVSNEIQKDIHQAVST